MKYTYNWRGWECRSHESIPRPFDERPKTFHCVGMYPTRLPFLTPVHRFMLHLFTDLVVAFILVGIEFGVVCFDKRLDKLSDCATLDIPNKFSDDFPASCDYAKHYIFRGSNGVRQSLYRSLSCVCHRYRFRPLQQSLVVRRYPYPSRHGFIIRVAILNRVKVGNLFFAFAINGMRSNPSENTPICEKELRIALQ